MTKARFNVLLEYDSGDKVWVSYVPRLNWLSTYGKSRARAVARTREAVIGYLQAAEKEGLTVPEDDEQIELTSVEVAAV
jgi:predicted RNase H-like HicB family nuclease